MRAPSVVIIASPYEGELLGRSLGETGLRVLRADGGDGGHALLSTELPIALVIGTSLFGADPAALIAEARARNRSIAIYLLAETDDPVATALRSRVTDVLRRPVDFEALAHSIEQLAVNEELVDFDDPTIEIIESPPPPPLPRIITQPVIAERPASVVAAVGPVVTVGPAERSTSSSAADLLRADDALGALVGIGFDEVTNAPGRARDGRSTIARAIDRELSQAERRLFPDAAVTPLPFTESVDYDDALGDIDLDSLGIDTIPGMRENGRRHVEPAIVSNGNLGNVASVGNGSAQARPVEEPSRPVQEEGSLEQIDIAELIGRLHAAAFSGALEVTRAEGDKVVYFDNGDPVGARSTLRHDHLAELLFRDGKLTREQVNKLRAHEAEGAGADVTMEGLARPVALRLVEDGLLKESEIFAASRRHLEELFFSLFVLQNGDYRLGPLLPASDDRVRTSGGTWSMVVEGVRRKYGLERLAARLGDRDTILSPTTLFARALEGAALTTEERRIAVLFDGQRTLADVRTTLGRGVTESMILAVAWALVVLGALERGTGAGVDVRYTATVVTADVNADRRAKPRAVDTARQNAERGVERERIAVKRAQILDADYFAILGVGPDVTDHELRRAHARQRADFDAAQFDAAIVTEQHDALAEIVDVLDEALRVLSVPSIRARYAAHLHKASS